MKLKTKPTVRFKNHRLCRACRKNAYIPYHTTPHHTTRYFSHTLATLLCINNLLLLLRFSVYNVIYRTAGAATEPRVRCLHCSLVFSLSYFIFESFSPLILSFFLSFIHYTSLHLFSILINSYRILFYKYYITHITHITHIIS